MDTQNKDGVVSPEELKAETDALVEAKEEEVKAELISEFGWDPVDNADVLAKAVAREMKHRKVTSAAIGQKIKYRTEAQTLKTAKPPVTQTATVTTEDIDKQLDVRLAQRDLDALELPDALKAEVKKVSSTLGISIKQALAEPYIDFKVKEAEKEARASAASIGRTGNSGTGGAKFSKEAPPEVDMATKEGRQKFADWKKWMVKEGF